MKKLLLSISFVFALALLGRAQTISKFENVYFSTGKYAIAKPEQQKLDGICELLAGTEKYEIKLSGHTDQQGDSLANLKLSNKRATEVKNYLEACGLKVNKVQFWGESKPKAKGQTQIALAENRRVEIQIDYSLKSDAVETDTALLSKTIEVDHDSSTIEDLLKQLRKPDQIFCINPNRDTIIRCQEGTILIIKAGTLKMVEGEPFVNLSIREAYQPGDQILYKLNTMTEGGLLSTSGMFYIGAETADGSKVELNPGKEIQVLTPTNGFSPDNELFTGHFGHEHQPMNWVGTRPRGMLRQVTGKSLICTDMGNKKCPFFWCKIKRFILKVLEGNKRKKSPAKEKKEDPCASYANLLKELGLPFSYKLLNAILFELIQEKGYADIEEMLKKVKPEDIEQYIENYVKKESNTPILQYYQSPIFSQGWNNIDRYLKLSADKVQSVQLNILSDFQTKAYFVIKSDRVLAEAYLGVKQQYFACLPKGISGILIVLRYKNNQSYFYSKEMVVDRAVFEVELKETPISTIKEELRKLKF